MKNAYPIVMTQGKEFVVVFVPDFNINTQGKDIPDAIEMARDAIGLMGIDMQDDGEALHKPKRRPARSFRWLTLISRSTAERTICAS